jgi:outer membrane protein insertion porin family
LLKKKYKYFLVIAVLPGLLSGCLGTRYLKEKEKFLYRQSIVAPKGFSTEGLSEIYAQKANRRVLGLPINSLVWMYYTGARRFHPEKFTARRDRVEKKFSVKIEAAASKKKKTSLQYRKQKKIDGFNVKIESGNLFMQWGEKVSVFDSANVTGTVSRLDGYLFTKGYFLGKTTYKTAEFKKRVSVKYFIQPGPHYYYDSVSYDVADSVVGKIIDQNKSEKLVKKGDTFDQDKLNKERERIDLLLKDHGYFDFSRQYVDFDIDTAFKPGYKIALRVEVKNPVRRDFHKQFKVDSVSFTTDASTTPIAKAIRQTQAYRGITFNYYIDQYSKKILSQRVFVKKDSLYNRTATFETQLKLSNLDVFKFVNINYDTSGGRFIANIFTSPLDRYSWSNEAGLTVTQGFPGPYYNLTFLKRNIFRGLESFDINGRFGFEGVASPTQGAKDPSAVVNYYKSTQASLNGTLTFPQFIIPLSGDAGYRFGKFNPKTKVLGGYTYTDRPPDYHRAINTVSVTYSWETKKKILVYSLTPINLNVIRSTTSNEFNALLDTLQQHGNNLINSFKPSFVSSMLFSVTWNPNNYGNTKTSAFFLRAQVESGGTLFNFYSPTYATNAGLAIYKYLRFMLEIKKTVVLDKNTVLAYRFNSGMAYSYGSSRSLPYEKYFFAGGSNGVRAWRPRRLGVGSNPPKLSKNTIKDGLFDYSYEKPGEILVEGSVELRKKLVGFLSGAAFIDAGNVWTFKQYQQQTGSDYPDWTGNTQFRLGQFYKEFGIGTGFGLRFDFSFLVLRLDVGIKAYDPARRPEDRFILNKAKFWKPYSSTDPTGIVNPGSLRDPVIYNVGIGYPF